MMDFYYVEPENEKPQGGVILIHEVWGLTDHIKDLANRFASAGYAVIAPDLLSHTGITTKISPQIMQEIANPETRDEAQKKMREAMTPLNQPEYAVETLASLQDCFDFLKKEKKIEKVAVIGFCFGGSYAYAFAAKNKELSAAVPFYGQGPEKEEDYTGINCPILAFYGEQDERLIQQLPTIEANMKKCNKDFQYKAYPNTGHAFMNDTNPHRYNKEAAEDAWTKTLEFLARNLSS